MEKDEKVEEVENKEENDCIIDPKQQELAYLCFGYSMSTIEVVL